ncbi:MAG: hypothetical protein QM586_14595 [Xenophilus sp.]
MATITKRKNTSRAEARKTGFPHVCESFDTQKAWSWEIRNPVLRGYVVEQNDGWSLNRRCMEPESLQALSDTAPTRLSAAAR